MRAVDAFYYTDPLCARSWAAEPARRRLERELGGAVVVHYVMGGLAREIERPDEQLEAWLDATARSAMPIDPRLWLQSPPKTSFPSCLAVLAAAEQGLAGAYLRRAREAVAFERRSLDHRPALLDVARDVPGLSLARFESGLGSHAILEAFGADLERTREGDGLPRVEFRPADREAVTLAAHEIHEPAAWVRAARAAGAVPVADGDGGPRPAPPSVEEALREHHRLATAEVAELCDLPGPRAAAELWRLATEWRVRAERHLSGETWVLA